MKSVTKKYASLGGVLLVAAAYGSAANAHELLNQALAAGNKVDYFNVTCSASGGLNALRLEVAVKAKTAGAPVVVVARKLGSGSNFYSTATSVDVNQADGAYSASSFATPIGAGNGNGTYDVYISNASANASTYDLLYHCKNGNTEVGTAISAARQNQ